MANDLMRLSGINSGYDTEAMIQKMMTSYQTKIDNQNKKLTKLSWQQEAYRDVIDKITSFKNKYFDILNRNSYLMSPTSFNKFKSTITNKATGEVGKGLEVLTSSGSVENSYKVKLKQLATAATAKGTAIASDTFALDLDKAAKYSEYTTNDDGSRTYNFALDVKVGDVTKTVEFSATAGVTDGMLDSDAFKQSVITNLNEKLSDAFGTIGADRNGNGDPSDDYFLQVKDNGSKLSFEVGGNAAVTVTEKTGNFGMTKPSKTVAISTQAAVTGNNTISVTMGNVTKNVSFNGVSETYFDSRSSAGNEAILREYNQLKEAAFRKENKLSASAEIDQNALNDFAYTSVQAAKDKNSAALQSALNSAFSSEGVQFSIDGSYVTAKKSNGAAQEFTMTAVEGGTFGLQKGGASNRLSDKTKLYDLGITPNNLNADAVTGEILDTSKYTFKINGKEISVGKDATISDLLSAVNKSDAGVTMSYSALTNTFELTAKDMGSGGRVEVEGNRITEALGLATSSQVEREVDNGDVTTSTVTETVYTGVSYTAGQNAIFDLNGVEVFHNSNSYTTDGTTFKFSDDMELNTEYVVGVSKSYDDIKQTIKDFVNDYNQLIDDVYGHIGTAPARDSKNNLYDPLTDEQKEDMSEEQIKKWEEAAKKGVIYNDSTISSVMSQLRTALYNSVKLDDGTTFGLFNMGISTASYRDNASDAQHGKLVIDEDKLDAAFEKNADAVTKLFTDSESGIMKKVSNVLDNAVRTSGTKKGVLINKAGLKSGTTAKDNFFYRQMQQVQKRIDQLQKRYDSKEDYWWKVFTNLEKVMGNFNDQSNYIATYMSNFGNNNNQ